jgi:hypothetical protein
MNATEVTALIVDRASRFGDRNPQQLEHLTARLRTVDEGSVAQGLLSVFTDGPVPPDGSAAQELAGRLLDALRPKTDIDLAQFLPAVLGRYELSVEQLPHYLRWLAGVERLLAELDRLERSELSAQERRTLQTLRFWLRK